MKNDRRKKKKLIPLAGLIAIHIAALGAALLLFALPHHVIAHEEVAVGIRSSRTITQNTATAEPVMTPVPATAEPVAATQSAAVSEPVVTPEPTPEPTPVPTDAPGSFRIRFSDKFTDGGVKVTDSLFQNENVNITFSTIRYGGADCHIADIYVADISCFATCLAKDTYGKGYSESCKSMAKRNDSLVLLSGDFYGARSDGVVIRNGMLYRNKRSSRDIAVLYWDGTMKTFSPKGFKAETEMANGAYQAWNFGPMLLDENGQPMTRFNSDVSRSNPRSAIGCIEPGHYCFVMVDGRSRKSDGLELKELSQLMFELGCTSAYNLDGGQSAVMVRGAETLGKPVKGGRKISDALMILAEPLEIQEGQQ